MDGRVRLSTKSGLAGKSAGLETVKCDGEGKLVPEAADFTLSRKAASETVGARTANRHR